MSYQHESYIIFSNIPSQVLYLRSDKDLTEKVSYLRLESPIISVTLLATPCSIRFLW